MEPEHGALSGPANELVTDKEEDHDLLHNVLKVLHSVDGVCRALVDGCHQWVALLPCTGLFGRFRGDSQGVSTQIGQL